MDCLHVERDCREPLALKRTAPRSRSWRRWAVGAAVALLVLCLVVAVAPMTTRLPPVRNAIVGQVFADWRAEVTAEHVSAGWFSSVVLDEVVVRREGTPPELTFKRLRTESPFWRFLLGSSHLGNVWADGLHAKIDLRGGRTNLDELVPKNDDLAMDLTLRDSTIELSRYGQQWLLIRGADFSAEVRPGPDGREFVIAPCRLLDHERVLLDLRTTDVRSITGQALGPVELQGEASLYLDEYRKPARHPEKLHYRARFVVHSMDFGEGNPPSRALTALLSLLNLAGRTDAASPRALFSIEVQMRDGQESRRFVADTGIPKK